MSRALSAGSWASSPWRRRSCCRRTSVPRTPRCPGRRGARPARCVCPPSSPPQHTVRAARNKTQLLAQTAPTFVLTASSSSVHSLGIRQLELKFTPYPRQGTENDEHVRLLSEIKDVQSLKHSFAQPSQGHSLPYTPQDSSLHSCPVQPVPGYSSFLKENTSLSSTSSR